MCPLHFLTRYFTFATVLAIAMTKTSFLACWCTVKSTNFFWFSSTIKSSDKEIWHSNIPGGDVPTATQQGRAQLLSALHPSSLSTMPEQDLLLPGPLLCLAALLPHHLAFSSTSSTLGNVNFTALHTPWEDPREFHAYPWNSLSLKWKDSA